MTRPRETRTTSAHLRRRRGRRIWSRRPRRARKRREPASRSTTWTAAAPSTPRSFWRRRRRGARRWPRRWRRSRRSGGYWRTTGVSGEAVLPCAVSTAVARCWVATTAATGIISDAPASPRAWRVTGMQSDRPERERMETMSSASWTWTTTTMNSTRGGQRGEEAEG